MNILYQVIIETQKARTELLKWKLIISSTLAGVGLGLTNSTEVPNLELLLCCIPFVCFYVDLLCSHYSMRIQVIGTFFRLRGRQNADTIFFHHYERFVEVTKSLKRAKGRPLDAFIYETLAMYSASLLFSGFVLLYGLTCAKRTSLALVLSGLTGTLLIAWIKSSYKTRYLALHSMTSESVESDGNPS